MTIGDRIMRLRRKHGYSADQLGKLIGKDRSTIYRYERGDIENATIDVLPRLAKALNTTPQHIMGWDEKPTFYWVHPSRAKELSNLAEHWYSFTGGYQWTEREFGLFEEQAKYMMRIKDTDEYDDMMGFLETFYRQLNK